MLDGDLCLLWSLIFTYFLYAEPPIRHLAIKRCYIYGFAVDAIFDASS